MKGARYGSGALPKLAALLLTLGLAMAAMPRPARADEPKDAPTRSATFSWDGTEHFVHVTTSFRDVVDAEIRVKLSRGLPITFLFTAAVFRNGQADPLATTAQTCRVTWHVWEEAYRLDISTPGNEQSRWTTTLEGVLRRCSEVRDLPVGDRHHLPPGIVLYLRAHVQVNPVSPLVIQKIKRWISRPSATSTARPGDALFSTFTGLFLKRIGEAERELRFTTHPALLPAPPRAVSGPPAT